MCVVEMVVHLETDSQNRVYRFVTAQPNIKQSLTKLSTGFQNLEGMSSVIV
jgi:hypothetical protein